LAAPARTAPLRNSRIDIETKVQQPPTDWLSIAREALALHDFAARHYVLQPPLFKSQTSLVRTALAKNAQAVVFLSDSHNTFFGFPDLTPADALLRALALRRETGSQIDVGAKANPRYDAMFAALAQHVGDESLPQLFSGAVAFYSLEAYVSVYANRPSRLLQPTFRARTGYMPFPSPSWQEHERFTEALRNLGAEGDA
jgi:hypothetical protein